MSAEQQQCRELETQLIQVYANTFISRWDRYAVQVGSGAYIQLAKPLTLDIMAAHLEDWRYRERRITTIGTYALDEQSKAKWICFDADSDMQWQELIKMAKSLVLNGVIPYLEPSRRGGHLWLFTPKLTGTRTRRFAQQLLSEHGLGEEKIEVYPKQDKLIEGAGSLVRLPLGIHLKTRRLYHFVDLSGNPLARTITEQINMLGNPKVVPKEFIDQVVARSPKPKKISPTPIFNPKPVKSKEVLSKRIKAWGSVYDFVSQFTPLDSQGRGHCPFHDDEHVSFQVNITHNYWNCYAGCGGGSIIDFWSKWREKKGQDSDFTATVTDLAEVLFPM